MSRYNLKTEQNIIDLAIQETGSVEGLLDIIRDNAAVTNINHVFEFGDTVIIQDSPLDLQVKNYFANRANLFVSTGDEIKQGDFNNDYSTDFGGGVATIPPNIITLQTTANVPTDTFAATFTAINGEEIITTLQGGYTEQTNSLSIASRTGLSGTPTSLAANELDGTLQNVEFAFSTDTPSNITSIDIANEKIEGVADLSILGGCVSYNIGQNNFENFIVGDINDVLTMFSCNGSPNLLEADLRPFGSNFGGDIQLVDNDSCVNVYTPNTTNLIPRFSCANSSSVENIYIDGLSNLSTLLELQLNSELLIVDLPTTSQNFTSIQCHQNPKLASLDFSGFSGAIGNLQCYFMDALASFSVPTNTCTLLQVNGGLLTTFDITPMTGDNSGNQLQVRFNNLTTASVNQILIDIDNKGWTNYTVFLDNNTVPAPPSGAGITALNNIVAKGGTVTTD